MTVFRVTSPSGKVYRFTAPEGATQAQALALARKMEMQEAKPAEKPKSFWQGVLEGVTPYGANAARIVGMANPIGGILDLVQDATEPRPNVQSLVSGKQPSRIPFSPSAIADVAQRSAQETFKRSPYKGSGAGKFVGGVVGSLPALAVPGGVMAQGAAAGALGSDLTSAEDIALNSTIGALLGKGGEIVGRPLGRFANYLVGRGAREASPIAQAAQQEGVRVSRPIIDPSKRAKMAYLQTTIGGSNTVDKALSDTLEDIAARTGQLGEGGTIRETGAMGQTVQGAVLRDLKNQRARAGDILDKAGELAGEAPVYGREIVASIDKDIAKLQRNPNQNKSVIDYLNGLKADFVNPETGDLLPKTVSDIRAFRTGLRGDINSRNLTQTPAEAIVSRALKLGKRDIARDMLDAGPKGRVAADLYREGDIRWSLAKRDEKQVVQKLIGNADNPKPGKDVMGQAVSWLASGGDNGTHAARFWAKLNPSEQRDFAATVASRYGRQAPDLPFSPAQFIAATNNIPPSSRALIFGPEGARSIANLRALTKAYQNTVKALNNSHSGQVINWGREFNGIFTRGGIGGAIGGLAGSAAGPVGAAVGGAAGAAVGSGAKLALQRMSARSLMNPDVSKWLSVAPRQTNPAAINAHIQKLTTIAARNPVIAHEVLDLQKSLMQSLGEPLPLPGKVAADSGDAGPDNADQQANAQ